MSQVLQSAEKPHPPRPRPGSGVPGPGRPKGSQNRASRTIREAIELACQPGACHAKGLAGWLIDRATGGVEDRKIFAGLVAKVVPAQLHATVDHVTVQLPWLAGRSVVSTQRRTQTLVTDSQPIELEHENVLDLRVDDPMSVLESAIDPEKSSPDPLPPIERQAGGGSE